MVGLLVIFLNLLVQFGFVGSTVQNDKNIKFISTADYEIRVFFLGL